MEDGGRTGGKADPRGDDDHPLAGAGSPSSKRAKMDSNMVAAATDKLPALDSILSNTKQQMIEMVQGQTALLTARVEQMFADLSASLPRLFLPPPTPSPPPSPPRPLPSPVHCRTCTLPLSLCRRHARHCQIEKGKKKGKGKKSGESSLRGSCPILCCEERKQEQSARKKEEARKSAQKGSEK